MAQKNNIRSIRFSDDMAELIDQQAGDTFTQKFENLITRCVWELPKQEMRLAEIKQDIERERSQMENLQKANAGLRELEQNLQRAKYCLDLVERQAKQAAEMAGAEL